VAVTVLTSGVGRTGGAGGPRLQAASNAAAMAAAAHAAVALLAGAPVILFPRRYSVRWPPTGKLSDDYPRDYIQSDRRDRRPRELLPAADTGAAHCRPSPDFMKRQRSGYSVAAVQQPSGPSSKNNGIPMDRHARYQRLLDACEGLSPTPTAVVHPCDAAAIEGAIGAAKLGLIKPILVGPQAKIAEAAKQAGVDLAGVTIVDAPHSHAAAAKAVELVHAGQAEALMKGSLHTDELMAAVVRREGGLRTARRVSHCFVMDVPGHDEPLIISDAAVNIAPTLEEKIDIVQNSIDLAHALRFPEVCVAILSAMETVNPKVLSTVEAAALCKMADRKQITGAILDGPLALDNAISLSAAEIKQIDSPVAGRANVLIVPDLGAGNMLAKSLSFLAGADAAGIVLGARVPIILTSRADSKLTRLASCAVAVLVAQAQRAAGPTVVS